MKHPTSLAARALPALALLTALLAALLPHPAAAQAWQPFNGVRQTNITRHALIHAELIPEPGVRIHDATILIDGPTITAVTPGAPPPDGYQAWDCSGLTVYPALIEPWLPVDVPRIDANTPGAHWNDSVMAQRSALDAPALTPAQRERLRSMGFAIAHVAPADGVLRGTTAVVSLAEPRSEADHVARVIRDRVAHAASLETAGRRAGYPGAKMGAIALIRQTLADVPWLAAARDAYERDAPGAQRPAPNHAVAALNNDLPFAFDVTSDLDALRTAKIAQEFDRDWFTIGSGREYRRIPPIAELARPIVVPLDFPKAPQLATPADREAVSLRELMDWEQAPTNPRRLDDAGLDVMLTSSKLDPKQNFHKNLRRAIETGGLSEDTALAMLTTRPARLLDIEHHAGRIAPGYAANIITVAHASLFDDKHEVRDLWIDGRRHEINPTPQVDMKGRWDVVFAEPVALNATLTISDDAKLTLEREPDPVAEGVEAAEEAPVAGRGPVNEAIAEQAAELAEADDPAPNAPKPHTIKTRNTTITENRLAFVSTDAETFAEGATLLSAVMEEGNLLGHGQLPDGTNFTWTGTPAPTQPEAGDEDPPQPEDQPEDQPVAEPEDKPAHADEPEEHPSPDDIPDIDAHPFGAFAYPARPAQRPILITNATIWTSGPDGVLQNAAMLVSADGKVERVWSGPVDVLMPNDAVIIDARGRHITPGLIDCHSHTGIDGGVNEATQSCTAEVRIADVIDPDDINFYRQLAGGLTVANQLHGSANAIGGQNSVVKLRWGATNPDDFRIDDAPPGIKFALGENVKQSNWGDDNTTRYPQTRMGVETFIRDRFTAAREYTRLMERSDLPIPPRRDLELEALAEILAGVRLVHCHAYRQDEILMLCRIAEDFDFTIGTFQHVLEGYKVAEAIRDHARGGSCFSDWWAYKQEVIDAIPYDGAIMREVGVTVSFNSDDNELARRLNTEAAKAVKYGNVPPPEALKFVTINPAIQLGIDHRVGSLEPGKDADFVVWSADPLSTTSRCEQTWIDGRLYFSIERDAELRQAAARERNRLIQKVLTEADKKRRPKAPDPKDSPNAEQEDAPARPGALPLTDLRAGGRMLIIPPDADGDLADIRDDDRARRLEIYFNWMILNGLDPNISRPGDCGCGIQNALAP